MAAHSKILVSRREIASSLREFLAGLDRKRRGTPICHAVIVTRRSADQHLWILGACCRSGDVHFDEVWEITLV